MEEDRLIDSELDEEEIQYDNKLRPDKLTEYIGQQKVKENLEISSKASENPIDPEMVRFRVQVGAFKEKVPDDILASFKKLGTVMAKTNAGQGYTKYYMGDFMEYKNVLKFRSKLFDNGLIDCFIVGEFQNKIITSREALNLLGQ